MSDKIISEANMNKSGVYPGWKAKAAADKAAADAAQAAKTEVTVTQVQGSTNGTKIATIGVDDVDTDIYAPAVAVTQVQGSTGGTKIATIGVGATSTDLYAPAGGQEEFEFTIALTYDSNGQWWDVSVNKTIAEVVAAYQAGKVMKPTFTYDNGVSGDVYLGIFSEFGIKYEVDTISYDYPIIIMRWASISVDDINTEASIDAVALFALGVDLTGTTWAIDQWGLKHFYSANA